MRLLEIDQRHFDLELLRPSSLVFDVGALHGRFSSGLANLGHSVVAFEPDPDGIKTIPALPGVTRVQKAMGWPSGIRMFHRYLPCDGANGFYLNKSEDAAHPHQMAEVEVVTLEDMVGEYGSPALLKINAEGAEVEILMHTPHEILQAIPQITVSFHDFCGIIDRATADMCRDHLRSLGYTLHLFPQYPDACLAERMTA